MLNGRAYFFAVLCLILIGASTVLGSSSIATGQQVEANETALVEKSINPPLRPIEWDSGDGQFPSFERETTEGYNGYLERKSDDRRVSMKYTFDESKFNKDVDTYILIARVAWHANGNGDQQGIRTVEAKRDIPGQSADESWGTVRLPISPVEEPLVEIKAIYGTGYLSSGTAVIRIQDLTVVPASAAGTLSDEEILEVTSTDNSADQETQTSKPTSSKPMTITTPTATRVATTAATETTENQESTNTADRDTNQQGVLEGRGLLYPEDGLLTGSLNAFTLSVIGLLISAVGVLYTVWGQK
ncbi:hypothetical protein [Haloarcula sp. CBA1122]|uniref:hypothetical protein n=1 Tax=Haloarcula sp. CBA1122 TaxID=2668069 RepID=UPI00174CCEC8|nr:hypothetical protein [Haloarcula sp. CBA1122]